MGISVADVTRSLGTKAVHRLSESTIDPRELLWGILHTLAQIRGSPSYLFPALLERCKTVLGMDCTITMGNFLPTLGPPTPDQPSSWAGGPEWHHLVSYRESLAALEEADGGQGKPVPGLEGVSQRVDLVFQDGLLS